MLVRWPQWELATPPCNEKVEDRKVGGIGLPARATRGRGLPSLDARSGRPISPHP
jgi:hypothetical protein